MISDSAKANVHEFVRWGRRFIVVFAVCTLMASWGCDESPTRYLDHGVGSVHTQAARSEVTRHTQELADKLGQLGHKHGLADRLIEEHGDYRVVLDSRHKNVNVDVEIGVGIADEVGERRIVVIYEISSQESEVGRRKFDDFSRRTVDMLHYFLKTLSADGPAGNSENG